MAIKLINKIKSNLYTYILFSTCIALLASVAVWMILSIIGKIVFLNKYDKRAEYIQNEIASTIRDENLTYYEALQNIDVLMYNEENIRLSFNNEKNNAIDNKMIFYKDVIYRFPVDYADGKGLILVKPIDKWVPEYYEVISTGISGVIFMFILFFFVKKPIKYIEEIEENIDIIAGGKLSHKIPVKGSNELARLAININEMGSQLEERIYKDKENDIKLRQIITNISHDLRTPLTVLKGYLDLLKIKAYENEEESQEFIDCAYNRCNHLQELMEDLFAYNKIINGDISVNIETVEMISFINDTISVQTLDINFEKSEKEIFLDIDKKLMIRILDNLFDNIKKYGIDNESTNISLRKSKEKVILIVENKTNNDLTYKVNDIFERTYVLNESRTEKSSGLGLAIVSQCAKLMNAKVYAEFEKPVLKIILEFNI